MCDVARAKRENQDAFAFASLTGAAYQRRMKINAVLKHPPPNFFAPQPAATPRRILLMSSSLRGHRTPRALVPAWVAAQSAAIR